jgi:predicted RNA-binding Zn-ribbon protein involved in translation (DUF1610 family)
MTHEMTCPRCGHAMNHQAEKLSEPTTREDAERSRVLGGILIAVFACPNCGWIVARREDDQDG